MLARNEELNTKICKVWLKPVGSKPFSLFSEFVSIYATPSTINLTISNSPNLGGLEYSNKLKLIYPGLKKEDFPNFHLLSNDRFVAKLETSSNHLYKLGSTRIPLKMTLKFTDKKSSVLEFSNKSFNPITYQGKVNDVEIVGFPYILKTEL